MSALETLLKVSLATPVIWRLVRMISGAYGATAQQGFGGAALAWVQPGEVLGCRVMDCLYWNGVFMSAQPALWVACGFAVLLMNWVALACLARLAVHTKFVPLLAHNAPSFDAVRPVEHHSGVALPCL